MPGPKDPEKYKLWRESKIGDRNPTKRLDVRQKMSESQKGKCGVLNSFYGKTHSKETKDRISQSRKGLAVGEANGNYIHGMTKEYRKYTQSMEHKEWRKSLFERDNYTCKLCGKKGGKIHPHHIFKKTEYKQFRSQLWNGITLCADCHKKTIGHEDEYVMELLKLKADKPMALPATSTNG